MSDRIRGAATILAMTVVFLIVTAVAGLWLPLSNDLYAAMSAADKALFRPLYILDTAIKMAVLYAVIRTTRLSGRKRFAAAWMASFGLFNLVNATEMLWYKESFPLITFLDIAKMVVTGLIAYGVTTLVGTLMLAPHPDRQESNAAAFRTGPYHSRVLLFCLLYPIFYYACGFISWSFTEARAFYANWATTAEPTYALLLFNVFRGGLWLGFSAPVLVGVKNKRQAFWLMPAMLFAGTSISVITPSALLPGIVRFAHFIELGISMAVVGLFMAWLFVKPRPKATSS